MASRHNSPTKAAQNEPRVFTGRLADRVCDRRRGFEWDTWTVPCCGGTPRLAAECLRTGVDRYSRRVLFSEMRKNPHMGIVTAEESRIGQSDVYLPDHVQGMAHLSYPSPDRQIRTARGNGSDTTCGHRVAWCRWTAPRPDAWWARPAPAARSARGRLTEAGYTSRRTRAEAITSGDSVFLTESQSRSHRVRPKRKASRWLRTAVPWSPPWPCAARRCGSEHPQVNARCRLRGTRSTPSLTRWHEALLPDAW